MYGTCFIAEQANRTNISEVTVGRIDEGVLLGLSVLIDAGFASKRGLTVARG